MFKGKPKRKATAVEAASYNTTTNHRLLPWLGKLCGGGNHVDSARRRLSAISWALSLLLYRKTDKYDCIPLNWQQQEILTLLTGSDSWLLLIKHCHEMRKQRRGPQSALLWRPSIKRYWLTWPKLLIVPLWLLSTKEKWSLLPVVLLRLLSMQPSKTKVLLIKLIFTAD